MEKNPPTIRISQVPNPVSGNCEVHKLLYLHLHFSRRELYWADMKPLSRKVPDQQLFLLRVLANLSVQDLFS